jgi:MoCo/4Fe-4S cofactor protein with predicted Tat translocation signal
MNHLRNARADPVRARHQTSPSDPPPADGLIPSAKWRTGVALTAPTFGYWRSLSELSKRGPINEQDLNEFSPGASEWHDQWSRRDFVKLLGASLALAGFSSCTKQPIEKIVPYVKQPEEIIPGKPLRFATVAQFGGFAQGLLVTSYEGRPTKIEGNPNHPASLGASTIWAQADVLDLYDPDRAQAVTTGGAIKTKDDFWDALQFALQTQKTNGGATFRILSETIGSPTLLAQLADLFKKFPAARSCIWDPMNRDNLDGEGICTFSQANVIVALDSDFLYAHPYALRYARDFANARRVIESGGARMNRFYAAEPTPTITGSNADHRIAVAARDILPLAQAIAAGLGLAAGRPPEMGNPEWIAAVVEDLEANRGASVVIAGEMQPAEVHEIVRQINAALGNDGQTIAPAPPPTLPANRITFPQLVDEMRRGAVELLVMLGGNPAYDAPVDLNFADALEKVKLRVHHSVHFNETSRRSHWHLPATHFLESWSDAQAFDGTISIVQPLIEPMYSGVSAHELADALNEQSPRAPYEIVRSRWEAQNRLSNFETKWRRALSDGITKDLVTPSGNFSSAGQSVQRPTSGSQPSTSNMEILFRPDVNVLDGRYANNSWLQELPRQFSKLVWDNAALISPALAKRNALQNGDVVEVSFRNRTIKAPVWIQPGQAENSVTLPLGFGREVVGRVGRNVGFNANLLRVSDALWFGDGLTIRKTGATHLLASTQQHHSVGDRGILHDGTLDEFTADPHFAQKAKQLPPLEETLYQPDEFPYKSYKWAMVVDLNTCIGCHACTIACQAENNIPIVGKQQVALHREMHWIRVDTYYSGEADNPKFTHQPVPCMHCETAPCELVCPVGATVHDNEGLNLQVYNRCVGTRYCSNNCPYKVRRFNFFEYNNGLSPSEKLVKNPDVTVRSRGVMEKCTYCIQRINAARIHSELEQRRIRDGEIVPACAQACPAEAIIFGDMNDSQSRLARWKRSPLNYWMLGELNTRPRTSYFARLRNPNPQLRN